MTATIDAMKKAAASAALEYIRPGIVIGVGTGSTVNFFIEALASVKHKIDGAIASSTATAHLLRQYNIPILTLNDVTSIPLYIDGTDEFNEFLTLIKGGGGALTGEKILAATAEQFIVIADQTKQVKALGHFPLPIEVIPLARSYVAREIVKLGGDPVYRSGFVTDYGNIILDIHNLNISKPIELENTLNNIVGVVTNGVFAKRSADIVLMGTDTGVKSVYSRSRL